MIDPAPAPQARGLLGCSARQSRLGEPGEKTMSKQSKIYAVLISSGGEYRPVVGWDEVFSERKAVEACAARARRNDGWSAKVITMTRAEAEVNGWV